MAGVLLASLLLAASGNGFDDHARRDGEVAVNLAQAALADGMDDPLRYGFEYRFRAFGKWRIYPVTGVISAGDGASFVYLDLRHDIPLDENWFVTGSLGLGRFDPKDVLDLGHLLEFRTGVAVSRQFADDRFRLELGLYHFSNGGLSRRNPGTEVLVLSFGVPIRDD